MRSIQQLYIGVIKKMPRGFLSAFLVSPCFSCLQGRLMDCEIALIQAWIKQGALNN
jgi:hypothetical protein